MSAEHLPKLLIVDTHPVQYRAPIYQELYKRIGERLFVLYLYDYSVKNGFDKEFGIHLSWDLPLLSGYSNKIIFNSFDDKNCFKWYSYISFIICAFWNNRPDVVLLNGIGESHYLIALFLTKLFGIPVCLRSETQDNAFYRSRHKTLLRFVFYRLIYSLINHFFYIGKLNKEHYLKHKVKTYKISQAKYCTVDKNLHLSYYEKLNIRKNHRDNLKISIDSFLIGFSGKLIPKKNPEILYEMLSFLTPDFRSKVVLYFVGSGPLCKKLQDLSRVTLQHFNVPTFFAGFVNQSFLHAHYLAMDVLVLPSNRMGETWGLVVNEGLQSGCSVVVSDAVGCYPEFQNLERFRVFDCGNPRSLAESVMSLAHFERNFSWAAANLRDYSVNTVVDEIINKLSDRQ